MATVTSGVYPVFNNVFKIGTKGRSSAAEDMKTIADCETFSLSMDNNVEEWTPMTTEECKQVKVSLLAFQVKEMLEMMEMIMLQANYFQQDNQ